MKRTLRIASELAGMEDDRSQRPAPRAAGAGLLAILAAGIGFSVGCASSPTCQELEVAADRAGCPERVVTETIETFDTTELLERLGSIENAPPLTSAELVEPTAAEALDALIEDLKATRSWGWSLHDQLMDLRRALLELRVPE
jgi:hypothetical protein